MVRIPAMEDHTCLRRQWESYNTCSASSQTFSTCSEGSSSSSITEAENITETTPLFPHKMPSVEQLAWGYRWRSSTTFVLMTVATALFTDVFLIGFVVPILPYMVEDRIGQDPSITQTVTFALLAETALVAVIASPLVGHIADRFRDKKSLLLSSLAAALISSVCLALSRSVAQLFLSRFIQALASSSVFVLGLSTVHDNVPSDQLGKTLGLVTIAISVGTSAGTMVAGMLLELVGYWATWSAAYVLIACDAIMRLLMIERPKNEAETKDESWMSVSQRDLYEFQEQSGFPAHLDEAHDGESAPFLNQEDSEGGPPRSRVPEKTGLQYYTFVLRQRRFAAGVTCYMCYSMMVASFDTTLPLHVRDVFEWGSLPAGLMFLALNAPGVVLAPLAGTLKDRVGTRIPSVVGFLAIAPFIWLLGMPGDARFSWMGSGSFAQALYTIAMLMIGCSIPLLNSIGTLEVALAVDEIQTVHPGIFGPQGGHSRAVGIANMSWTLGIFFGPIISGTLADHVGYFEMNTVLAVLCLLSSLNSYCNLGSRVESRA